MNRPIKDLIQARQKLHPEWSPETNEFFDELYSRLEWAETAVEVFNARLKGEWTVGSKLYTEKELDALVKEEYKKGFGDGEFCATENCRTKRENPWLLQL